MPLLGKKSAKSEVQFLAAIMQRLAPGGRAAVIAPMGLLFNRHAETLRRRLLEGYGVRIVALPGGVFQPFTGVITAALLIEKTGQAETQIVATLFGLGRALGDASGVPGPEHSSPLILAHLLDGLGQATDLAERDRWQGEIVDWLAAHVPVDLLRLAAEAANRPATAHQLALRLFGRGGPTEQTL